MLDPRSLPSSQFLHWTLAGFFGFSQSREWCPSSLFVISYVQLKLGIFRVIQAIATSLRFGAISCEMSHFATFFALYSISRARIWTFAGLVAILYISSMHKCLDPGKYGYLRNSYRQIYSSASADNHERDDRLDPH